MLYKLLNYVISGRIFVITKSFLLVKSMKVVFMASLLKTTHISTQAFPWLSLLTLHLFLLYIKDLLENIFRSLVNIYIDGTTVYGCTSKYLNDQSMPADLHLIKEKMAFNFQYFQNQVNNVSSSLSPVMMNSCTLNEIPCFEHLPGLRFTPDLKWNSCI